MATTKTKTTAENPAEEVLATAEEAAEKDDRVEVYIPRGAENEEQNLFVSVNGVGYLLPRGKKSKVPKFIADEIQRSQDAQEAAYQRIDEMLGK